MTNEHKPEDNKNSNFYTQAFSFVQKNSEEIAEMADKFYKEYITEKPETIKTDDKHENIKLNVSDTSGSQINERVAAGISEKHDGKRGFSNGAMGFFGFIGIIAVGLLLRNRLPKPPDQAEIYANNLVQLERCTNSAQTVCSLGNLANNAERITVDQVQNLITNHLVNGAVASGNHMGADKVYVLTGDGLKFVDSFQFDSSTAMLAFFRDNHTSVNMDGSENDPTPGEKAVVRGGVAILHLLF